MIPYGRHLVEPVDVEAVGKVLTSERLTQGPEIPAFEAELAGFLGARHVVAVSSGTAALHLACLAAQVGPGDLVLTTPITFVASANCAVYCGAEVALVDVDPVTVTLDPGELDRAVARGGKGRVRAVIPVDFAGHPARLDAIAAWARAHEAVVIEDACHALGGEWRDAAGGWRRVGEGSAADMSVFSFHPVKHITTGEGGAIVTNRDDLAQRLRLLRTHGITHDPAQLTHVDGPWYYEMLALGFNYRITDIQCALGRSQLRRLPPWVARRRAIARRYDQAFAAVEGIRPVGEQPWARSAYHLYVVRVDGSVVRGGRAALFGALQRRGLGVQVHYVPVHYHPFYASRPGFGRGAFPHAERYYAEALSLPLFPGMSDHDVETVIGAVCDATAELGAPVRA